MRVIRVVDSDPHPKRNALIKRIGKGPDDNLGLEEGQTHLTGMPALYNNVLQTLFRSQILAFSVVFLAIGAMLSASFRNWKLAAIGIVPMVTAASLTLGTMGWPSMPSDFMTRTVAAICFGLSTGMAMLIADLTLLPLLIVWLKPLDSDPHLR